MTTWQHPKTILDSDELGLVLKWALAAPPDGAVFEFGSYAGGTALALAHALRLSRNPRMVFACDTFSGFPVDDTAGPYRAGDLKCAELPDALSALQREIAATPHLPLTLVVGPFSDTLYKLDVDTISFAFFDCDIRPSLEQAWAFVQPRLDELSIFAFHDYGYYECPAVKAFVDATVGPNYRYRHIDHLHNLAFFQVIA